MSIFSKLGEKSWAFHGVPAEVVDRTKIPERAAKTGLGMFIAVLTSMFFLFVVGYRMRMMGTDWQPLTEPGLLWFNTLLLVLGSVAMELAKSAAGAGKIRGVRQYLTLAGILTGGFLLGQYFAWQGMRDAGMYMAPDPAAAFFVLLTGIHALHLFGGLLVEARATLRAWQGIEVERVKLSIELCATYWHYLLLVWLVFFTLLLTT